MRYQLIAHDDEDTDVIYDSYDKSENLCIKPVLKQALNDAGTLEFTLLPDHPWYDKLKKLRSTVTFYKDNVKSFLGRILVRETELDGQRTFTCEGPMTFFLDSEMEKGTYTETIAEFMARCISAHNSQVESFKQFTLGNVTADKAVEIDPKTNDTIKIEFKIEDYTNTKNVLESLITSKYGGFFRIRYGDNDVMYLDYIQTYGRTNTQPIKIAENIIEKDDHVSAENLFTVLRPLGKNDITIESLTNADLTTTKHDLSINTQNATETTVGALSFEEYSFYRIANPIKSGGLYKLHLFSNRKVENVDIYTGKSKASTIYAPLDEVAKGITLEANSDNAFQFSATEDAEYIYIPKIKQGEPVPTPSRKEKTEKTSLPGYWALDGTLNTQVRAHSTPLIPVEDYTSITGNSNMNSSGYVVAFFDQNKNLLPSVSVVGTAISSSDVAISVSIPNTAVYAAISNLSNSASYVYTFEEPVSQKTKAVTADYSGFWNIQGELQIKYVGWHTFPIYIGDFVKITGQTYMYSSGYAVLFLDDNQQPLTSISIVGTDDLMQFEEGQTPGPITIPSTAKYVSLSGISENEDTYEVTLLGPSSDYTDDGIIRNATITGSMASIFVIEGKSKILINDLIEDYGYVLKTERFSEIDDPKMLLKAAEDFINRYGSQLPSTSSISFVDFHILNPNVMGVLLGDEFTQIEGFPGETMTVGEIEIDLEDPANDNMVLKNAEEIAANDPASSSGSLSASYASKCQHIDYVYKYITEEENKLTLMTDQIKIVAHQTMQLSSVVTNITSGQLYMVADVIEVDDPDNPGQKKKTTGDIKLVSRRLNSDSANPESAIETELVVSLGNVAINNGYLEVDSGVYRDIDADIAHINEIYSESVRTNWLEIDGVAFDDHTHGISCTKNGNQVTITIGDPWGSNSASFFLDNVEAVNVVKGSWSGGRIVFSPSSGTGSNSTVQIEQGSGYVDGNRVYIPVNDSGLFTGYTMSMTIPRGSDSWTASMTAQGVTMYCTVYGQTYSHFEQI